MSGDFRAGVRRALADEGLQEALDRNAERRRIGWEAGFATLSDADGVGKRAAEIRRESLRDLDGRLASFAARLRDHGVVVHEAADAAAARRIVVEILASRGARRVVKSKSMVSEEIRLNPALQAAGIEVVETDLGEFIVQLRGEPPTHITAPALHLRREDVGRTFEKHLGVPFTTDVAAMTAAARRILRRRFLEADAGISGVNFGVAETGTLCLVTNEGNGRLVTGLPPLHVAVMGIERVVPSLDDLSVMLDVLPRAATGQSRTSYVTLIAGERGADEADGPCERHVVLVDNGRRAMLHSDFAEALACIRCGACLNACPVYQEIGGRGYDSIYPGPIGSVVSPWLFGRTAFSHLARASTLCGACREACPVDIDLPSLLVQTRASPAGRSRAPRGVSLGARVFAWAIASPRRYRLTQRVAALGSRLMPRRDSWITALPWPVDAWTRSRDFPVFAARPFRDRWGSLVEVAPSPSRGEWHPPEARSESRRADSDVHFGFVRAVEDAGGEVVACEAPELTRLIVGILEEERADRILTWQPGWPMLDEVVRDLVARGVSVETADLRGDFSQRRAKLASYDAVGVGITGAAAGLADAGSLVLPGGGGCSQLASLLPPVHLAVLRSADLFATMGDWFRAQGERWLGSRQGAVVITGPSRTADIEMTLTTGVHGPRRLVIFLVD